MKKILAEVLDEIKPSKQEEAVVKEKVELMLKKINSGLSDAKAILGGSGIKGTWLRQANDIDIFVKYDYKKYNGRSDQLSSLLERHLKKKFNLVKLHGSRDYFQVIESGFTVEIVPILDIKNARQAKNITDISPLHATWVNKRAKNLKDDIRLLKQFCKAGRIYGAESYIQGFSGYICEILIVNYNGFVNLIKSAAKWKDRVIIDVEKHWKNKNVLMELNKSKINTPLIIVDPVQAERNAAAAVSKENFELFVRRAKSFLKKPSKDCFVIKKIGADYLRKKASGNVLIMLEATPQKGKVDVVGCKLVRAFQHIRTGLSKNDFLVIDSGWEWDSKALFYYIIKKQKLSDYIEREGPPVSLAAHVKKFKDKHKATFTRNGKVYAKEKRAYNIPEKLISAIIKNDDYLKDQICKLTWKE